MLSKCSFPSWCSNLSWLQFVLAYYYSLFHRTRSTEKKKKKRNDSTTQKATQTEQQIDYKVRLDARYKMRMSNSKCNNVQPSEKKQKIKTIT